MTFATDSRLRSGKILRNRAKGIASASSLTPNTSCRASRTGKVFPCRRVSSKETKQRTPSPNTLAEKDETSERRTTPRSHNRRTAAGKRFDHHCADKISANFEGGDPKGARVA